MMVGQFDEFGGTMRTDDGTEPAWERPRDALADFRALGERNLGSIAVEPGAGHFAWSDRNAAYLSLFIRKAAQARIPKTWPVDARVPVALSQIDPRSGWLTDLTIKAGPLGRGGGAHGPAAYADYGGERARAAWHFDEETARATVAYHAGLGGKDQFIRWDDPHWVDAGTRFFFTRLEWVGDGQTFEVHPVYAERYPGVQKDGRGPRWPRAGEPVGHSTAPIRVRRVSGPVVAAGDGALRMRFDALAPAAERARVTFMASSDGDADFRHTEQVGMMPRGFRGLSKGRAQTITFPELGDMKADGAPVELNATSDSGLPVEYYVAHGPAVIEDGKLRIAELPARTSFPVAVKVVAYQFGSGVEPLVKTAAPVERSFRIGMP